MHQALAARLITSARELINAAPRVGETAGRVRRFSSMHAPASPWFPIATAPRVPGVELLLWSRDHDSWVVGYWDGEGWYVELGLRLNPPTWAPLPGRPTAP